jgi:hypothetical protein
MFYTIEKPPKSVEKSAKTFVIQQESILQQPGFEYRPLNIRKFKHYYDLSQKSLEFLKAKRGIILISEGGPLGYQG